MRCRCRSRRCPRRRDRLRSARRTARRTRPLAGAAKNYRPTSVPTPAAAVEAVELMGAAGLEGIAGEPLASRLLGVSAGVVAALADRGGVERAGATVFEERQALVARQRFARRVHPAAFTAGLARRAHQASPASRT